jgi:hypothetical protein
MINEGQVKAKINSKEQMISFIDTESNSISNDGGKECEYLAIIEELESQSQRIISLMEQITSVDEGIQSSNQFIKKTLLGKDRAAAAKEDSSSGVM